MKSNKLALIFKIGEIGKLTNGQPRNGFVRIVQWYYQMGSRLKFTEKSAKQLLREEKVVESQLVSSVSSTFETGLRILRKKNHDYASAEDQYRNFARSEILGVPVTVAIMIRLEDKISRIENLLLKDRYVTEETIDDTIVDAINYLAILKARMEFERQENTTEQIVRNQRIQGDYTDVPKVEVETFIDKERATRVPTGYHNIEDKNCPVCRIFVNEAEKLIIVHATVYHEHCFYERKR